MKQLTLSLTIIAILFIGGFAVHSYLEKPMQVSVGGGTPTLTAMSATSTDLQTAEENYKNIYGKYKQVMPGISAKTDLGKDIAPGVMVDEYVAPNGPGYQVRWEDNAHFYSKGFGPQATDRTWTQDKPTPNPIFVNSTST